MDRRSAFRAPCPAVAVLTHVDGLPPVTLHDLSVTGCRWSGWTAPRGTSVTLLLILPDGAPAAPIAATVVRPATTPDGPGVAARFATPLPLAIETRIQRALRAWERAQRTPAPAPAAPRPDVALAFATLAARLPGTVTLTATARDGTLWWYLVWRGSDGPRAWGGPDPHALCAAAAAVPMSAS